MSDWGDWLRVTGDFSAYHNIDKQIWMLLWITLTFKVDREWPEFSRLNLIAIVDSFRHPSECCSSVDYQITFLYIACSQMSTRHHCKAFLAYAESILVE